VARNWSRENAVRLGNRSSSIGTQALALPSVPIAMARTRAQTAAQKALTGSGADTTDSQPPGYFARDIFGNSPETKEMLNHEVRPCFENPALPNSEKMPTHIALPLSRPAGGADPDLRPRSLCKYCSLAFLILMNGGGGEEGSRLSTRSVCRRQTKQSRTRQEIK